jgi:hypothetical protein
MVQQKQHPHGPYMIKAWTNYEKVHFNPFQDEISAAHEPQRKTINSWNHYTTTITKPTTTHSMQIMLKQTKLNKTARVETKQTLHIQLERRRDIQHFH